ncbi:MAG: flagellar filament capping protein FliD [Proteobacteria bacterium]|nr:flagellar filament capping protein FliD [Pseudomonadota bacterium]
MGISAATGITSGIDYGALIEGLVGVKRQPISQLQGRLVALEATNSAYETLGEKFAALQTAADDLKLASDLVGFTAESTNNLRLSASTTSEASAGTYSIIVQNLAQSHKISADGVAAETTTVAAADGVFKFTIAGGVEQSINITGGVTTLSDLRSAINNLGVPVTATIINDGDAVSPYRLILTSDETGAVNDIVITQNDTNLNFATTLQAAQDATITVDNLTITRASNTISDVITGVTLDLKSADALETITLTLTSDTDAIAEKIVDMLNAYNEVVNYIKANNRYDTETKTAQPLFGESSARNMLDTLRRTLSGEIGTLPATMNRLIHAGVETKDGLMILDRSDFDDAIASDFDGVINLFVENIADSTVGFGALVGDKVKELTDFADGQLTLKQKGLDTSIDNLTSAIEKDEEALAIYEERLRMDFVGLELLLTTLKSQSSFLNWL